MTNNNLTHEIEAFEKLMEPWEYNVTATILFLIGLCGFSLNLLVIVLMFKDLKLWTPTNIILFNLVISDFLVSIFGNPFTLTAALAHRWIFGNVICIIYGFFMALFGITSITTLTVLSYERYCLVVFPLSHKMNYKGAIILIILIWTYSSALTTPPLFGWGQYVHEAANISCSVNWETKTYNATSYIVFLFFFGLIVPLMVITFSYINIIRTMRKNALRLGRTKNRAEGRVTLMVAIMITAFLFAWLPYSVFALIEQFGPSDLITPKMAVLPALIAKSSICYNPLIYIGLNTQFRASFKRIYAKESTMIETTINQLSQTSNPQSPVTIDCRPRLIRQTGEKYLKRKKLRKEKPNSLNSLDSIPTHITKSNRWKEMIITGKYMKNAQIQRNQSCDGIMVTTFNELSVPKDTSTENTSDNNDVERNILKDNRKPTLIRSNSYIC